MSYEVPAASVNFARIFETMERERSRLEITEWGLNDTTLEEVFLRVGAIAEEEA